MKALIIIDMQQDFMPWGAFPVVGAELLLSPISQLSKKFTHIYASQKWYGSDHNSFAANHGKRPGEEIPTAYGVQRLMPVHCLKESLGADLVSEMANLPPTKIFRRGKQWNVDSPSIFFDKQRGAASQVHEELQEKQIEELYFVGVSSEGEIEQSLMDALFLSYQCYFVQDACAFRLQDIHLKERISRKLQQKGVRLVFSSQIS